MLLSVKEDARDQIGRTNRPFAAVAICLAIALSLTASHAVFAQNGDTFSATVLDMSAASRSISVPLRQSIIVETSVEVARTDIVAGQIVDVQPVSPRQLLFTGQSFGRTNVVLWDKEDNQYLLDVSVELDLSDLNSALSEIDPLSSAEARSLQGNIVLVGTVSNLERAERMQDLAQLFLPPPTAGAPEAKSVVQNLMNVAGEQQVLLRCIVAEVSRTAIRDLGINGFLAGDNVRDAFLVNQIGGINPINIGAAASADVTQNLPFLTGVDGIPITSSPTLSLGFPRVQTQLFIRALANNTLLHILAEPNLVSTSGETATFLAGGEFPIPVPQGNQQVTIEFREFGIRLNFTPVVLGDQLIRLRVAPEVSELDFSNPVQIEGFVVPGLTTRAAETTVEIGNGQTLAIAGLLNEQIRGFASRVPGIGDVPVIGALFRSINYQRSLTELVILVTPEIIAPLDPHQRVALPGGAIQDPSDYELFAMGMIEGGVAPHSDGKRPNEKASAIQSQPRELSVHGPWGHQSPDSN